MIHRDDRDQKGEEGVLLARASTCRAAGPLLATYSWLPSMLGHLRLVQEVHQHEEQDKHA